MLKEDEIEDNNQRDGLITSKKIFASRSWTSENQSIQPETELDGDTLWQHDRQSVTGGRDGDRMHYYSSKIDMFT